MITQEDLQARLDTLSRELDVPGAAVAISKGDHIVSAVTGTANLVTGLPVEPHTLFAAGSTTKVFTATLIMTLVDEGLVDLDAPVRAYLPAFTVGDDPRSADVTVRMLLDHASGLPGNFTYDVPKGPQVVERFVEMLREFELNSPPGRYWSYSNAGLVTAGRVAEVVTGQTFDEALADRVLRPLGLNATSDSDEKILVSTAVGHIVGANGDVQRVPRFQLGTNAPSGSALGCDIAALISFGRMHLRGGLGDDGTRVLSAESVAAMQTPQISLPEGLGYDQFGIGWAIRHLGPHTILGHTGASAGQHSTISIIADQQGVVAALTNSTSGAALYTQLCTELLEECFGISTPVPVAAPEATDDVDITPFAGRYVADDGEVVITDDGGVLSLEHEVDEAFGDTMRQILGDIAFPPPPARLTPTAADGVFVSDVGMPVRFVRGDETGAVEYAYVGRIYRRRD